MQTLRHLELVRALAHHKHFGKAADALGISQPALTRSLQHLEGSLGVKLFDREAGPVEPTLFGRIVLERGEAIIAGFAELKRELLLARNLDLGVLTVGAGPFPAEISVYRATGRLSAQQPLIHTSVTVKDWLEVIDDVIEGRADIGVADLFDAIDNPALEVEPIRQSALRMYCRREHPLAVRNALTMEDLFAWPWVGPRVPRSMSSAISNGERPFALFEPATGRMTPRIRLQTVQAIRQVVENSDALSAAPDVLLAEEAMRDRFAVLPVEAPWLRLNYGFIWRRGRTLSPAATALMHHVRTIEAEADARLSGPGCSG